MNCIDEQTLWEYLDQELEPTQQQAVERHLKTCPNCQQELQVIKALNEEIASLVQQQPSLRFPKKVMELIEIEVKPNEYPPLLKKFWQRLIVLGLSASFATILFIGFAFPVSGKIPFEAELLAISSFITKSFALLQHYSVANVLIAVITFWLLFMVDKMMLHYVKRTSKKS